ncbi:MAG: TlyA family rRNA (cytidine-2'-O)-methyltransferase, partial [Synechococcaceae bacterium WB7_1B_046]|nr:TlyA family rRNA (cytidine-2'-O)-methyltransferase [Synechococcaceae bacterium WB7_1B_046]
HEYLLWLGPKPHFEPDEWSDFVAQVVDRANGP